MGDNEKWWFNPKRHHFVWKLVLRPIESPVAVAREFRKILPTTPYIDILKGCKGELPIYTYDNQVQGTSWDTFEAAFRLVLQLGLPAERTTYKNEQITSVQALGTYYAKA